MLKGPYIINPNDDNWNYTNKLKKMETETKTITFGQALEAVKEGKLAARSGWNGKGMFIFMRPEDTLTTDMIINKVKSLPQSVKDYFYAQDAKESGSEQGLTKIKFTAYLCMKAADNSIVNGWLASQTDMLATDWTILN